MGLPQKEGGDRGRFSLVTGRMSTSEGETGDIRRHLAHHGGQTRLDPPGRWISWRRDHPDCRAHRPLRGCAACVWHRKISSRKVEKSVLTNALAVDVASTCIVDLDTPLAEQIRAWVGILAPEAENLVEYPCLKKITYSIQLRGAAVLFGSCVADEQFGFTTLAGRTCSKGCSGLEGKGLRCRGQVQGRSIGGEMQGGHGTLCTRGGRVWLAADPGPEEELDGEPIHEAGEGSIAVETAVLQLTKIAQNLTSKKCPDLDRPRWEAWEQGKSPRLQCAS